MDGRAKPDSAANVTGGGGGGCGRIRINTSTPELIRGLVTPALGTVASTLR